MALPADGSFGPHVKGDRMSGVLFRSETVEAAEPPTLRVAVPN